MEVIRTVYLGLGSNLGDSKNILKEAICRINNTFGVDVKKSQVYASAALNPESNPEMLQPDYLNMVCSFTSALTPREILTALQFIETSLGLDREKKEHWGPRLIDIDILSIDDLRINDVDLKIPHPEMTNRDFVLIPLQEIEENYVHPISKARIADLIGKLEAKFIKKNFPLN